MQEYKLTLTDYRTRCVYFYLSATYVLLYVQSLPARGVTTSSGDVIRAKTKERKTRKNNEMMNIIQKNTKVLITKDNKQK